jgi:soluble lytic murein transglycosylase
LPGGGEEAQDFAAWLAEWYHLVYLPGEQVALERLLRSDNSFLRADAFLALHMDAVAERELNVLEDTFGSDPRMLDLLVEYFETVGLHKRAIRMAERILGMSPAKSIGEAPVYLRRKICPEHFGEIVTRACGEYGIDRNLFYSLIRQESLFEPDAVSWVGARGLAQIMPHTGRWIARKLGDRGFQTRDLLDPETNIRFGTYYLSVQLEDHEGDIMRALAAYNGGPDNVERWWEYSGAEDQDVFVEDIGFAQTDDYVRRVYLYAQFYRETYGER